jgi:hypothetical protein
MVAGVNGIRLNRKVLYFNADMNISRAGWKPVSPLKNRHSHLNRMPLVAGMACVQLEGLRNQTAGIARNDGAG